MGIEPTLAAWEAAVLPLNYARAGRELYVVTVGAAIRRPAVPALQPAAESGTVRANGLQFHDLAMGHGPLAPCLHGLPYSP
jgi:hypothetical protein